MDKSTGHLHKQLNTVIHPPIRLSIIAMLSRQKKVEFGKIRDAVGISAAALSKNMTPLEAAGYIEIQKGYAGKRPRTWLSITDQGSAVFQRHTAALLAISRGLA
ncbi:MarR family transcriptional regulator [Sphaerisporangium rufum]|uniref:MarR family transcriptional regulator n=1 Tax=Sphaerisporangium rufum TaxID=1381558 RepID=A0A919RAY2_9ACTN|nr:transcriptional regulator [Sphaerisporangium rufum]GII81385.1 MarR family transcriptional regulator [Sphaerisporangium rufum]